MCGRALIGAQLPFSSSAKGKPMSDLFIVDVKKRYIGNLQPWGNRYIIRADDLTAAQAAGPIIAVAEKNFHSQAVEFLQYRVATLEANDGLYISAPITGFGDLVPDGVIIPIQTCVRVDFSVAGFGRPSRKFYHVCVGVGSTDDVQRWDAATVEAVDDGVQSMLGALESAGVPMVDPQDQTVTGNSVMFDYAYHQFHKRSTHNPTS